MVPECRGDALVDPQAQSLRTTNSLSGTPASAATRRSGKTVLDVVA